MKTKLKSGNAVVRFLLGHGEKLGIVAIGICTALVVWSALGRERLGREPAELKNLANQASTHVDKFTWEQLEREKRKLPNQFPNRPWRRFGRTISELSGELGSGRF